MTPEEKRAAFYEFDGPTLTACDKCGAATALGGFNATEEALIWRVECPECGTGAFVAERFTPEDDRDELRVAWQEARDRAGGGVLARG